MASTVTQHPPWGGKRAGLVLQAVFGLVMFLIIMWCVFAALSWAVFPEADPNKITALASFATVCAFVSLTVRGRPVSLVHA